MNSIPLINVTPHPVRFKNPITDIEFVVPPNGIVINAKAVEDHVRAVCGIEFVRTRFVKDEKSVEALLQLRRIYPDAIIFGSIIAAQAYPNEVVALTPAPGFERAPVEEKRMNPLKFTTFEV